MAEYQLTEYNNTVLHLLSSYLSIYYICLVFNSLKDYMNIIYNIHIKIYI